MFSSEGTVFKKGKWENSKEMIHKKIPFPPPYGPKSSVSMFFEEVRKIKDYIPDIQNLECYVSGFNWFTQYIGMPVSMILWMLRLKKLSSKFFWWSMKRFNKPPYGCCFNILANGNIKGVSKKIIINAIDEDPYYFTAVPCVAFLLQYLDGFAKKKGIWFQGEIVDIERFFKDIIQMKIRVKVSET